MKIFLMRHGETDHNKERKIQGSLINPYLNSKGKEQALKGASFLKNKNITKLYSTSMNRAQETALIVKEEIQFKNKIETDDNYLERFFGEKLEGLSVDDYYLIKDISSYDGYELDQDLEKRISVGLIKTIQESNLNDNVLIVTHSHTIKAILVKYFNFLDYKIKLNNCAIIELEIINDKPYLVGISNNEEK